MIRKKYLILPFMILLLTGAFLVYVLYFQTGVRPEPFSVHPGRDDGEGKILFISDTQSPMWVETLVIEETRNEDATDRLFDAVKSEGSGLVLFHLGDLSAVGSSGRAWKHIDRQFEKLKSSGISIYPTLGNHDYLFSSALGLRNFQDRFPYCRTPWYCARVGALAVVMLNSNFDKLSEEERHQQQAWYRQMLRDLEEDPSVRMVWAACHHAPYTNSTVIDPSEEVQRRFVGPFVQHPKCRLFLSGHAHAFEHFRERGKDFIVLGGGGGLLHPLLQGNDQRWMDRFPEKTETRYFHYVRCEGKDEGFTVTCRRLTQDHRGFDEAYRFFVPFPK
jgi:hypothetical protein